MNPGRFMGFACNIGDYVTFTVFQCNSDPHKRNFFNGGVVVPHYLTAMGYNSTLAPKNDVYLPSVQVEGGITSKTIPSEHQGTVDIPNISIAEGGGKRRKPLSLPSSGINRAGADQPIVDSNEAEVDGQGIAGGFPSLANRGGVNNNGTSNETYWAEMVQ